MKTFTAYIGYDPVTKCYIAVVPGVPGAQTQGYTVEELYNNLEEVLETAVKKMGKPADNIPYFVGIREIAIADE